MEQGDLPSGSDCLDHVPKLLSGAHSPSPKKNSSHFDRAIHGEKPIKANATRYPFDSNTRGVCFIADCTFFSTYNDKSAVDDDIEMTQKAFSDLGFECVLKRGCTANDLTRKSCEVFTQQMGIFACVIFAHGRDTHLWGNDRKDINFREMFSPLTKSEINGKPNHLVGKPKLFFVQVYQEPPTHQVARFDDALGRRTKPYSYSLPAFCDFLFSFSTPPGFFSQDVPSGMHSEYIRQLAKILSTQVTNKQKWDIQELLQMLSRAVQQQYTLSSDPRTLHQVPVYMSSLIRELYLTKRPEGKQAAVPQETTEEEQYFSATGSPTRLAEPLYP